MFQILLAVFFGVPCSASESEINEGIVTFWLSPGLSLDNLIKLDNPVLTSTLTHLLTNTYPT